MTDPNEPLEVLRLAVSRLDECGVDHMLTGSMALAVYAIPRMTRDADLVIDCNNETLQRLVAAFEADCYVSQEAAQEALETRGMFNVIHNDTLFKLDFIIRKPDEATSRQFARRRSIDAGGFVLKVISPEDLVVAKLLWSRDSGSSRQEEDVRMLLRSNPSLDLHYLEEAARRAGVHVALARLMPHA